MAKAKCTIGIALLILVFATLVFAQSAAKILTNADVIEMTRRGMSVAEITKTINSSQTNFDISYPAMLQLQQSGVDPAIGNLIMNVSVRKVVAGQLGVNGTMDLTLPPGVPTQSGQVPGQKQQVQVAQAMMLSDEEFKAQQDQVVQTLAEHGCFGPAGPKLKLTGGKAMMCQGVSSNMAPGTSAKNAGATTTMASGFMIGGEHSITSVSPTATLEIILGEVPGASVSEFKPLLVKLASSSYGRVVARTNMKVVAKFPIVRFETQIQDDVVPAEIVPNGGKEMAQESPVYTIKPAGPLAPGEYGIVLRRGGSPNMTIKNASNDPAMGIVQAVWDFRVEP